MTMIFDHNNNSEEWQMFFDKINNGSPFGVIKEVFFYDHSPNNPNKLLNLTKACFLYMKTSRVQHLMENTDNWNECFMPVVSSENNNESFFSKLKLVGSIELLMIYLKNEGYIVSSEILKTALIISILT
ncbi:hypothetical protein BTM294_17580 [Helicobacter pylori]|nr:hypothetical protein [Helicobacter pylori]